MCGHCEANAALNCTKDGDGYKPRRPPIGSDPYGATKPSAIPRPGPRGREIVPKPGLPAEYPRYLKPIPVNDRDIEAKLQSYVKAHTGEIERSLYSTWEADAEAIKYQEISNAIRDGELPKGWVERWQQSYARFINDKLAPDWVASMAAGGGYMADQLAKKFGINALFPDSAQRLNDWIKHRAAELAVNFSDQQTLAVRALIRHLGVDEGMGPTALARYLRPVIGLTFKEEAAVMKYRQAQLALGRPEKAVEHLVGNYSGFLHRRRAERIAQTELSFAYNNGALEEMRHVRDKGIIRDPIVKKWLTAGTEHTCEFCEGLNGQIVDLEETYPGATDTLPNTYVPPAHPKCQCTLLYELLTINGRPNIWLAAA